MNIAVSKPINAEEVPFKFEELFFSRTDDRGIVISGNSVFQKISIYEWEEILKKPHNLIRHSDMPKAVFYLLWDTIKKGEPIGAYVKNRAKDGRYYWVFAVVTPMEGGYLSVRLKPSTEILKVVEQEYKALVALENSTKITPKESAAKLLARLKELGFNNYQEFMSAALAKEMQARNQQLGRPEDNSISCFDGLMEEAQNLIKNAGSIITAYEKNEYVPINLQVQSTQLGESGATIDVISRNYHIISTEIQEKIGSFMESAQQVFSTVNMGRFLVCTAKLQQEVTDFFKKEEANEKINQAAEIGYLEAQKNEYSDKVIKGIRNIVSQINMFLDDCTSMKMLASGLEVTRVMGKVESSRLPETKEALNELINDLESFQRAISDSLKEIEQMNKRIKYSMESLLKMLSA